MKYIILSIVISVILLIPALVLANEVFDLIPWFRNVEYKDLSSLWVKIQFMFYTMLKLVVYYGIAYGIGKGILRIFRKRIYDTI